jgi:hypothetical protein
MDPPIPLYGEEATESAVNRADPNADIKQFAATQLGEHRPLETVVRAEAAETVSVRKQPRSWHHEHVHAA